MPDEKPNPPSESLPTDWILGPHILTCQRLSIAQSLALNESGWFMNWVLIPFVCMPQLALAIGGMPFFVLITVINADAEQLRAGLMLGGTVLVYAFFIWRFYWVPRGDYLILHQLGFRIRIGLRTANVLFDDLHDIVVGRTPIPVDTTRAEPGVFLVVSPYWGLIVIEPPVPDELVMLTGTTMELHFADGTKQRFPEVLKRFADSNLQAFFEFVYRHHPRLLPPIVPK